MKEHPLIELLDPAWLLLLVLKSLLLPFNDLQSTTLENILINEISGLLFLATNA